jgi:DNA-directed RNA polymerase I, II, and III subunit RPABC2
MEDEFFDYFEEEQESDKEEEFVEDEDKILDEEEESLVPSNLFIAKDNITTHYLTKYERAKVIGIRATQLSNGAQPTIQVSKNMSIYDIAWEEIKQKKCPYIVKRYLPDGSYEEWKVNDLEI